MFLHQLKPKISAESRKRALSVDHCTTNLYLLLADLGEVPHVEAAVGAGGGQDGLVVGGPLHLKFDKMSFRKGMADYDTIGGKTGRPHSHID